MLRVAQHHVDARLNIIASANLFSQFF